MDTFIKVTSEKGNVLYLNTRHITRITIGQDKWGNSYKTRVYVANGELPIEIALNESAEQIEELLGSSLSKHL